MRIKLITITLFSLYDVIFNVYLVTESVLNQTIHFVLLAAVVMMAAGQKDNDKVPIHYEFIKWVNVCYWASMAVMYIIAAIVHPEWEDWINFAMNKTFIAMFFIMFMLLMITTWFLWKVKKVEEK